MNSKVLFHWLYEVLQYDINVNYDDINHTIRIDIYDRTYIDLSKLFIDHIYSNVYDYLILLTVTSKVNPWDGL